MPLFSIQHLTKRFGSFVAVNNVNLEIPETGILSIIGPNGAGKTTLFNLLTGFFLPDAGRVIFKGQDITGQPPYEIIKQGISRSFQITSLFQEMTVLDNVRIGIQSHLGDKFKFFLNFQENRRVKQEALNILDRVKLVDNRMSLVTAISHGDRKILDLALALTTDPSVLLLDEPMSVLSMQERGKITRLICDDFAKNMKLIIVEHDMDVVFSISDEILVLNQGRVLVRGTPAEISRNQAVQEAYLGGEKCLAEIK